jgi:hypothetical protein
MASKKTPRKDWGKPGDLVEARDPALDGEVVMLPLAAERCWQCRKVSLIITGTHEWCLNQCGPRSLCNMLRFS